MLLQKSHQICYRALMPVQDGGSIQVQGEAGVLGLLAYSMADILSSMKLSMYLLEIQRDPQHIADYQAKLHTHTEAMEQLVEIMRQLAVAPAQLQAGMSPIELTHFLDTLSVRLSTCDGLDTQLHIPDMPDTQVNLNSSVFLDMFLNLLRYINRHIVPESGPLLVGAYQHTHFMRFTIAQETLHIAPSVFHQANMCFCEGPEGRCTYQQPRSLKQNLEELTLANIQRIIELHNGTIHIIIADTTCSEIWIELPYHNRV